MISLISNSLPENKVNYHIWTDIAKFIGIILVIIHHTSSYVDVTGSLLDYIQAFINLFHMPLFFVIAGFLYKDKGLRRNYSKILWGLLIPYLAYQIVFLPFRLGEEVFYYHFPVFDTIRKLLFGIITGDVIENAILTKVCAPLWFLVVMIWLRIIFAHIKLNVKNALMVTIISIILQKILLFYHIDLYFCLDITLYAIPYFVLGYICKTYQNNIVSKCSVLLKNTFYKWISILLCIAVLIYIFHVNWFLHLARYTYNYVEGKSLLLYYVAGVLGSFAVCIFSDFFKRENEFVKVIARNTLFMIYFHWQLLFFLKCLGARKIIINYLYNINPVNIAGHHLIALQSVIICIILVLINLVLNYYAIKFLSKKCPIILGKRD